MLVDNPLSFYSPPLPTTMSSNDSDLSEFLNTDLFSPSSSATLPSTNSADIPALSSPEHSASTSSRASSPSVSLLTTPPQQPLQNSFPEIHSDDPYGLGSTSFLNFLNEDWKMEANMGLGFGGSAGGSAGSYGSSAGFGSLTTPLAPADFDILSLTGSTSNPVADIDMSSVPQHQMAIDPQLVGSPSDHGAGEEHHDSEEEVEGEKSSGLKKSSSPEPPMTITPVKVGGHGKARKGTVQGGGVTKKHLTPHASTATLTTAPPIIPTVSSIGTKNKENFSSKESAMSEDKEDNDDDLPADWRPPPEVFAKMTSKEKRQLRNKISARNFRVRRKEYISTLEMDIAERDRLLNAIRSELGSTQSENVALRQEIAALKKALLDGRHLTHSQLASNSSSVMVKGAGEGINTNLNAVNGTTLEDFLPPPAPLPERSAADEILARSAASPSSSTSTSPPTAVVSTLVTPNTQKDLSLSSSQAAFWGGVGGMGLGGGVTPVHTVLMPEISSAGLRHQQQEEISVAKWVRDVLAAQSPSGEEHEHDRPYQLQENMNPALNEPMDVEQPSRESPEFEKFVEGNAFTMKSIDAYRMHLWTKMAALHASNPRQPPSASPHTSPKSSPSPLLHTPTPSTPPVNQKMYHPDRITSPSPFAPYPSQSPPSPPMPSHYLTSPHLINPKAQLTPRNLASQLKPHYFVSSQKPNVQSGSTLSKVLGTGFLGPGIGVNSAKKSSPPSQEQQQQIMYAATATLASQTLLGKLGGAFWDAFSGSSSASSSKSATRSWDADKVRKVLEGKAVVKVVDVDEPHKPLVKKEPTSSPILGPSLARREDPTDWLEEKMKSLNLAKKH